MNLDHEKASVAEFEELKFALRDMVALSSKLSLRLIVMEAAVAEVISSMPNAGAKRFRVEIQIAHRSFDANSRKSASALR